MRTKKISDRTKTKPSRSKLKVQKIRYWQNLKIFVKLKQFFHQIVVLKIDIKADSKNHD